MSESEKKVSNIISNALQSKGWGIEKLSEETGIPERFIDLIIEDRVEDLPPAPYTHGYIVKIGEVLDLDGEKLWETYFKQNESIERSGEKDKLPENRFAVTALNKKALAILGIFVLVGAYFLVRTLTSSNISDELTLNNLPAETVTVSTSTFTVNGNVNPQYELTINQSQVYPDRSGNFEKEIKLDSGLNTIVFSIEGLLGKEGEITRRVFYNQQNDENTDTQDFESPNTSPEQSPQNEDFNQQPLSN